MISVGEKLAWLRQVCFDVKSASAFRLAFMLSEYTNPATGDAWPSQTRLATDLGIDERNVRHAVNLLVKSGHLEMAAGNGRGRPTRYRLIIKRGTITSAFVPENRTETPTITINEREAISPSVKLKADDFVPKRRMISSEKADDFALQNPNKNPNIESKKSIMRSNRSSPIKEDWKPGERETDYASSKGLSQSEISDEAERFVNYWLKRGGVSADWSANWRTWILNFLRFRKSNNESTQNRAVGTRLLSSRLERNLFVEDDF